MFGMTSPWEEAKGLMANIVKETTSDTQHPPNFHWLGDHTQLTWGLKELEWMPHINLIQELLQLTDVIANVNPNTQELMSSLSSQLELFYTSTHAELQSLHYYCSTTLCRHMNDQLMLAVDKGYERLVLAVIGCIHATQSLQMTLESLPAIMQVAYMHDVPCPTLFSFEEQLLKDDIDKDYSSDDSEGEKCEFLNGRLANFGSNINSSSSLQEARAGFLRLVMGEDLTDGPTESPANIDSANPRGSISTEEFIWSLGEQEEDNEQNYKAQEFSTLKSSAVTSLLANASSTNSQSEDDEIFVHQQQQLQQQQYLEIYRKFAQHPLLPHRLHSFLENPVSSLDIKRPWESPKIMNANSNNMMSRSPDLTKNAAKSPTLKDHQYSVNALYTGTSATSKQKIDGKGKRQRNNSYEESKDGPIHSAKRPRTSLEANASKMQKRFLSMVDQIVSSKFVDKLENGLNNKYIMDSSNEKISESMSSMCGDTAAALNIIDHKPGSKTLSIAEVKKNITETSPNYYNVPILFNALIRPKAGYYKEIDNEYSTLEKDINPNLVIKENSQGVKIFSNDKNKNEDICKSPRGVTAQTSIKTKVRKTRGRPKKILK